MIRFCSTSTNVTNKDVVNMQPVHTLLDAIQLATRAEFQLNRTGNYRNQATTRTFNSSPVHNWPEPSKGKVVIEASQNQNDPYAPPRGNKCYRCGEVGHFSNTCPKRQSVNLLEHEDEENNHEEEKKIHQDGLMMMRACHLMYTS
ncbi:hypothetical protein Vadar_000666 [Vaccinium darrowii]|uniref:Uncharacterized protein n=1 Tax=Vaccinium darrowii TaxID=229202 RepID=A0ACB7YBX6_9ERIC|nr:hypothetical protein Vadar_000666 [Vaccinium darrowii]